MAEPTLAQLVRAAYPGAYDRIPDAELERAATARYGDQARAHFAAIAAERPTAAQAPAAAPAGPLARAWQQAGPRLNPVNLVSGAVQGAQEAVRLAETDPRYLGSPAVAFAVQGARGLAGEAQEAWRLAREGDVAGALGVVGANAALMAAPKVVPKALPRSQTPIRLGLREASTMTEPLRVARELEIPVDLATATDSPTAARITRGAAASSLPAAVAHEGAMGRMSVAVERGLGTMKQRVSKAPTSELAAGEAVQTALVNRQPELRRVANVNYETFREITSDPRYVRAVPMRVQMQAQDGSVVWQTRMVKVPAPTDLRGVKAQLAPVVREVELRSTLVEAQANPGLRAMQNVLALPDYLPVAQAEVELGALKAALRKPGQTARSQSLALRAVRTMQRQIDQTVRQISDPRARLALESGRRATSAQYYAQRLLEMAEGRTRQTTIGSATAPTERVAEPVGVFRRLTRADDQSVRMLRRTLRREPQLKAEIGRALIEKISADAFDTNQLGHTDRMFAAWQNVGPATKRLLYTPSRLADLDAFFLLLKKLRYEPNPSGSGYQVAAVGSGGMVIGAATGVVEPLTLFLSQLVPYGIVKIAYSPRAVRALTRAGRIAFRPGSTRAQVAAAVGHLQRAAAEAGALARPMPAPMPPPMPLAADEGEPDR